MHNNQLVSSASLPLTTPPAAAHDPAGAALARRGARQLLAVAALLWFPLTVTAALTGAFAMGPPQLVPVFVLSGTLALVFWFRRSAALRAFTATVPLTVPILFHVSRALIGADFLRLYAAGELPAAFALHAGIGDIIAGLTALVVLWPLGATPRLRVLRAWNIVAFADIATVLVTAQVVIASGDTLLFAAFARAPYGGIPVFLVAVFATHLLVFHRLRAERAALRARG